MLPRRTHTPPGASASGRALAACFSRSEQAGARSLPRGQHNPGTRSPPGGCAGDPTDAVLRALVHECAYRLVSPKVGVAGTLGPCAPLLGFVIRVSATRGRVAVCCALRREHAIVVSWGLAKHDPGRSEARIEPTEPGSCTSAEWGRSRHRRWGFEPVSGCWSNHSVPVRLW